MRFLLVNTVLAFLLGLAACGSGGGGGGTSSGSTPPSISDLSVSPSSAAAGRLIDMGGQLTLSDSDGDMYGGAVYYTYESQMFEMPLLDPNLMGLVSVRGGFSISVQLSATPGPRDIDVWMLDAAGHRSNTLSFTLQQLWTRQFGTEFADVGEDLCLDVDDSVVVAGTTYGDLHGQLNEGSADIFVTRHSDDAQLLRTVLFGGTSVDTAHGIALDALGNLYVAGETLSLMFDGEAGEGAPGDGNSDGFLSKRDAFGAKLWTRMILSGSPDRAHDVAVDSTGVYVVGDTYGALNGEVHAGGSDAYLCKFSLDGTLLWTRQWGTRDSDLAYAVALDGVGGVFVAGSMARAVMSATIGPDAFVHKFDLDGVVQWPEPAFLATAGADWGRGLAVDSNGVSYVVGRVLQVAFPGETASGRYDAFVGSVTSNGVVDWVRQFGDNGNDGANAVVLDGAGRVYVTGYLGGDHVGDRAGDEIFVTQYDAGGDRTWYREVGVFHDRPNNGRGIALDSTGNAFVTGSVGVSLDYLEAFGEADAFLVRYSPDGGRR